MGKKALIINESLKKDLFLIPLENKHFLVYSPLRRKVFCINDMATKYIQDFVQGEEVNMDDEKLGALYSHLSALNDANPIKPLDNKDAYGRTLTIILSQICNMECSYCYAQKGHSNDIISLDQIKIYIDYFYNKLRSRIDRIVFIGGGEPMMTWPLLRDSILFIKQNDTNIHCSVITNGSILSDEQCDFFVKHNVRVIVSFDILPQIQNMQRPIKGIDSHSIVSKHINKLTTIGNLCNGFRSTITELNVAMMEDMVLEVARCYPSIKSLNLEPVSMHNIPTSYYKEFINHFLTARTIGIMNGINVYCSISLSLGSLKERFCQREICLTPSGHIVSCHRSSSPYDDCFDYFKIGEVSDTEIHIANYESMAEHKKWQSKCEKCFAKWHCAGGCVSTRLMLTTVENEDRCSFIRSLIAILLYHNIDCFNQ